MLNSSSHLPSRGFRCVKSSRAAWIIQIRSLWRCSREMMSRLLIRQTQMSARVAGKMLGAWPGLSRGGGNRRRRQSFPARSTQIDANLLRQGLLKSTDRLRLGSAPPNRTPCLSRMSALEQSIRKFAEEPSKSVVRPELGLIFDLLGEAYDF